jgi:hypothetical protein
MSERTESLLFAACCMLVAAIVFSLFWINVP